MYYFHIIAFLKTRFRLQKIISTINRETWSTFCSILRLQTFMASNGGRDGWKNVKKTTAAWFNNYMPNNGEKLANCGRSCQLPPWAQWLITHPICCVTITKLWGGDQNIFKLAYKTLTIIVNKIINISDVYSEVYL